MSSLYHVLATLFPCIFPPPVPSGDTDGEMVNYPSSRRQPSNTTLLSSSQPRSSLGSSKPTGYFSLADSDSDSEDRSPSPTGLASAGPHRLPVTSMKGFSPPLSSQASPSLKDQDAFVLPGSALQKALAESMQSLTTTTECGDECVICMESFTDADPKMLTLCNCGMNKTNFHYRCLLQWTAKEATCPSCRNDLLWEEAGGGHEREEEELEQREAERSHEGPILTEEDLIASMQLGYISSDDEHEPVL